MILVILQGVPPASNSRLSPLPPEPAGFYNYGTTVDIPIDAAAVGMGFLLVKTRVHIFHLYN
jgi:hypothetical protein